MMRVPRYLHDEHRPPLFLKLRPTGLALRVPLTLNVAIQEPSCQTKDGIPIALNSYLGMFINEYVFSFALLSFAGLLCLFGLVILIDGIKRLVAEWYEGRPPALVGE